MAGRPLRGAQPIRGGGLTPLEECLGEGGRRVQQLLPLSKYKYTYKYKYTRVQQLLPCGRYIAWHQLCALQHVTYMHVHVYVHVYVDVDMCAYVYVHVYLCVYICTCMCTCTHPNIHTCHIKPQTNMPIAATVQCTCHTHAHT